MPADFSILPARRLVHARGLGRLTGAELLALVERVLADPGYRAKYDVLADGSAVTTLDVTTAQVRALVQMVPPDTGATGRRVIVAPMDVAFGLARMFQLLRDEDSPALCVVRTLAEAQALLAPPSPPSTLPRDMPPPVRGTVWPPASAERPHTSPR